MKPSLAFMGALLVAFAMGTLLTRSSDDDAAVFASSLSLTSFNAHDGDAISGRDASVRGFAPDWRAVKNETGVFVPNLGQVNHGVYFQLIGSDRVADFGATSIGIHSRVNEALHGVSPDRVSIRFVGANRRPDVRATNQSERRLTYTSGRADKRFEATVPLFSEITYKGLYDGVDLSFAASQDGATRSFRLDRGTDPSIILLHLDGADDPFITSLGSLVAETPVGLLTYERPTAYQTRDGEREDVQVAFSLGRLGAFGFSVGRYDESRPLVIAVEGI